MVSKISMQKYVNNSICFIEQYENISISNTNSCTNSWLAIRKIIHMLYQI